ncbi:MAG: DUF2782 domain-containing protein [Mariprofundaceae bacterium]
MKRFLTCCLLSGLGCAPLYAAEPKALEPPADIAGERQSLPAAEPESGASLREQLTPSPEADAAVEVHRYERNGATYTEYALHGRVFMIKVQPAIGPAYYLVDTNGDGAFERRSAGGVKRISPPEWVIKRF